MKFLNCLIIVFLFFCFSSCGLEKKTRVKDKIAAQERIKFIAEVDSMIKKLEGQPFKLEESQKFQGSFISHSPNAVRKAINLRQAKNKTYLKIKFYYYNSINECDDAVSRYFEDLKMHKQKGTDSGVFAVINNYSVILLNFTCKNKDNKLFAKKIVPQLYKHFRKSDSRILNVECGKPLAADAERY